MSGGLIIRLKPHEKVLINGAILENGDKRVELRVRTPKTNILRLRDALHPEDADTPTKKLYFHAQLALTGDVAPEEAAERLLPGLTIIYDAYAQDEPRQLIDEARNYTRAYDFYHVMRLLKQLLPIEREYLAARDRENTDTQNAMAAS